MKIYEKYKLLDKYKKNSVKNEIAVMKKLQHKNLVKLQEVIYTQKQVSNTHTFISDINYNGIY